MKKRVFLSVLIIGAVMTGTFLVTRAFFRDTETATGSKITTGTLDMTVNGANGTVVEPFIVSNIGAEGNIASTKVYTIHNAGTLPGRLYFRTQDYVNNENGCNEPEALIDTNCGTDAIGTGLGELGGVLDFKVELADGQNPADNAYSNIITTDLASATEGDVQASWNALPEVMIPAGGYKTIRIGYSATENDYDNRVQSDSVSFNTRFDLVQQTQAKPTPGQGVPTQAIQPTTTP